MTHYIGVGAILAIRRSPASTQPANLLVIPARATPTAFKKTAQHVLCVATNLYGKCPVDVSQNGMDGRFEYVNAGVCDIVGYTAEELQAMTWQQITHPDDLAADELRRLSPTQQVEVGADRRRRWEQVTAFVFTTKRRSSAGGCS